MKALLATGIGSAALALSTFAAAPAQASPYSLDTMSSNMMSAAQALSLGVAGNHIRDFRYLEGTQESPDDFWLCDLAGQKEVEVDGSSEVYVVTYASEKSRVERVAEQELYAFVSEAHARKAMKAIRKAAKQCAGTFTVQEEGVTFSQKVSNGTGKASDGSGFTWITHEATASAANANLSDNDYNTFRRVGQFVQVLSIETAGSKAPPISSTQVKSLNNLTGTLGAAWAW
ncbi:MAG: hypothetical protein NWR17_02210 [Candidatus Nanopelagicales bacterium]|nr:hypothetical protein [Candidatus Nanopelagicales bacterium]